MMPKQASHWRLRRPRKVRMALRSFSPEKWVVKFALLASTLLRRELAANHLRVP